MVLRQGSALNITLIALVALAVLGLFAPSTARADDKVTMCHNGKEESVKSKDVPKRLAQGWTLGPCLPPVLMCDKDGEDQDLVAASDVNKRLAQGWTIGPCPPPVLMCDEDQDDQEYVPAGKVAKRLAQGWTLGACPKKVTICHKGHTIRVSANAVPAHLAHGDTLGPCTVTQHSHSHDK